MNDEKPDPQPVVIHRPILSWVICALLSLLLTSVLVVGVVLVGPFGLVLVAPLVLISWALTKDPVTAAMTAFPALGLYILELSWWPALTALCWMWAFHRTLFTHRNRKDAK